MSGRQCLRASVMLFTGAAVLAGTLVLFAPPASAQPSGRHSVKHSSVKGKTSPSRAAAGPSRSSGRVGTPGRVSPGPDPGPGRGAPAARPSRSAHRHAHYRADRRYSARRDAWRDYRRWRTITGLIRLGAYYATRPHYSTTVVVTGTTYYYSGGVYYRTSGSGYIVVAPPPGAVVYAVPTSTTVVYVGQTPYYYHNGTYYVTTTAPAEQPPPRETNVNVNVNVDSGGGEGEGSPDDVEMTEGDENYEVVAPPIGATVTYLPEEAEEKLVSGKKYYVYEGTYYQAFASEDETVYMVVETPT